MDCNWIKSKKAKNVWRAESDFGNATIVMREQYGSLVYQVIFVDYTEALDPRVRPFPHDTFDSLQGAKTWGLEKLNGSHQ